MQITFTKYQGTGNDFILLDNRFGSYNDLSIQQIQFLCDRKFGIGADGLIKINSTQDFPFEVDYYNSDGSKSFCGNGARCAVAFANSLGFDTTSAVFLAIDGVHHASYDGDLVKLKMSNVHQIKQFHSDFELNTGSPHYIQFKQNTFELDVVKEGRKIRYAPQYNELGINVNFVEELQQDEIEVLTYERGVEDETLSCGTGVTAAALAYAKKNNIFQKKIVEVHTKGGKLQVEFERISEDDFIEIFLIGPVTKVFTGEIFL